MLQQISAALLTIIQLLLALFGFPAKGTPQPQTDTPCVFVHGLGGWGNTTRSMRLPHTGA